MAANIRLSIFWKLFLFGFIKPKIDILGPEDAFCSSSVTDPQWARFRRRIQQAELAPASRIDRMLQISENGQKRLLRPRNLQKMLFHNSALLVLLRDKNSFVAHSLYIQRNVWDISHHFVIVLLFQSINLTFCACITLLICNETRPPFLVAIRYST